MLVKTGRIGRVKNGLGLIMVETGRTGHVNTERAR